MTHFPLKKTYFSLPVIVEPYLESTLTTPTPDKGRETQLKHPKFHSIV